MCQATFFAVGMWDAPSVGRMPVLLCGSQRRLRKIEVSDFRPSLFAQPDFVAVNASRGAKLHAPIGLHFGPELLAAVIASHRKLQCRTLVATPECCVRFHRGFRANTHQNQSLKPILPTRWPSSVNVPPNVDSSSSGISPSRVMSPACARSDFRAGLYPLAAVR
jgi:hypothetical protein